MAIGHLPPGGGGGAPSDVSLNWTYQNVAATTSVTLTSGKWYSFDVGSAVDLEILLPAGVSGNELRLYFDSIDDTATITVRPNGTDLAEGSDNATGMLIPEFLEKSVIVLYFNGPDGQGVNNNWEIPQNLLPVAQLEQAEYDALGTYYDWIEYRTPEVVIASNFEMKITTPIVDWALDQTPQTLTNYVAGLSAAGFTASLAAGTITCARAGRYIVEYKYDAKLDVVDDVITQVYLNGVPTDIKSIRGFKTLGGGYGTTMGHGRLDLDVNDVLELRFSLASGTGDLDIDNVVVDVFEIP